MNVVRWRKRSAANAAQSAKTAVARNADNKKRIGKASPVWLDSYREKRAENSKIRSDAMAQRSFEHEEAKLDVLYLRARRANLAVDHIIPLSHPLVCGLHVIANLRLMSILENDQKGSRWDGTHNNLLWRSV